MRIFLNIKFAALKVPDPRNISAMHEGKIQISHSLFFRNVSIHPYLLSV